MSAGQNDIVETPGGAVGMIYGFSRQSGTAEVWLLGQAAEGRGLRYAPGFLRVLGDYELVTLGAWLMNAQWEELGGRWVLEGSMGVVTAQVGKVRVEIAGLTEVVVGGPLTGRRDMEAIAYASKVMIQCLCGVRLVTVDPPTWTGAL